MAKTIDDLFREDDAGGLSVPVPDLDIINEIEVSEGAELTDHPAEPTAVAQTGKPGATVECEICGKKVVVKADGFLRSHKCEPKAQRGNRLDTLPERKSPISGRTRDFMVGVISWGIEESAAHTLARPFNADPDDVPTELPDADLMVGVPLDMVWPEIPKAAQQFLDKIADNADVIECGIAWFEWMRTIGKWTRTQRMINETRREMGNNGADTASGSVGELIPFIPTGEA